MLVIIKAQVMPLKFEWVLRYLFYSNRLFFHLRLQQEKRIFTNFHRQLFCWIDSWVELTMADIRRMEEETQRQLEEVRITFAQNYGLKHVYFPQLHLFPPILGRPPYSQQYRSWNAVLSTVFFVLFWSIHEWFLKVKGVISAPLVELLSFFLNN